MRLMRGSPDFFFGLERQETIMRENVREGREVDGEDMFNEVK